MPTYTFINTKTGHAWEERLSISEMEEYLKENPHIEQRHTALNIVSGVGGIKTDNGFKEVLQKVAHAHPMSELAREHGSKSHKDVKIRNTVEKVKKKIGIKDKTAL